MHGEDGQHGKAVAAAVAVPRPSLVRRAWSRRWVRSLVKKAAVLALGFGVGALCDSLPEGARVVCELASRLAGVLDAP